MITDSDYRNWLSALKAKFRQAQLKAAVQVNSELLSFYWELGAEIVQKQKTTSWGDHFLKQLSNDLIDEFPEIKGFSLRNLKYVRQWYLYWNKGDIIGQHLVAQFVRIPWGHNILLASKCETREEAVFYLGKTIEHGWSRNVLLNQLDTGLYDRSSKAITNFATTLPAVQSDLARQTLKDPYVFDFLALSEKCSERELENGLIDSITQFLIELGKGLAYMGRQYALQVGNREFFIDLLFYHTILHSHVVIELKIGDFEPEYAGKLNFYVNAVDAQLKRDGDNPTIGLLLVKSKDDLVAEYSLSGIYSPMAVSEYQMTRQLPKELQDSLPTIEALERMMKHKG